MKPVICLEMLYPELTISQKIREISQAGFPYLEFWDWKDKDIPLINSLSQKYKIRKEIIEKYLPYIGYFHIADLPGRHEPGTGLVDWYSILLLLKEKQYSDFLGFEYSPALDSQESLIKIKQLWNVVFPGFFN